jgi:hypothetical protein
VWCCCCWRVLLHTQAAQLREEFNIDIRVLGIADSKHMITSESGIDLDNWRTGVCACVCVCVCVCVWCI